MSLNIKSPEAHQLAAELARLTGESMTKAVTEAIRERLERKQRDRDRDSKQGDSALERGHHRERMRAFRRQPRQQPAAGRHAPHERAEQHSNRDGRRADDELDQVEPDGFVNQRRAATGKKEDEKTRHR